MASPGARGGRQAGRGCEKRLEEKKPGTDNYLCFYTAALHMPDRNVNYVISCGFYAHAYYAYH